MDIGALYAILDETFENNNKDCSFVYHLDKELQVHQEKKGNVDLQDLKNLTYTSNRTYRIIYEKIIQDSSFIDWRRKYFKTQ